MEPDAISYMQEEFDNAIQSAELDIKEYFLKLNIKSLFCKSVSVDIRKTLLAEHTFIISEIKKSGFPDYYTYYKDKEILNNIFQSRCMEEPSIPDEAIFLQKCYTLQSELDIITEYIQLLDMADRNTIEPKYFYAVHSTLTTLGSDAEKILKMDIKDIEFKKTFELWEDSQQELLIECYEVTKESLKSRKNVELICDINALPELTEHLLTVYPDEITTNILNHKIFFADCPVIMEIIYSYYDLMMLKDLRSRIKAFGPVKDKLLIPNDVILKESSLIDNAFTYLRYTTKYSTLTDLLDSLKKNNFIASDTILADFRKIFNNTVPSSPIKWTGNVSELFYFVKHLHSIPGLMKDLKANIWKVTAKIFVDENGNTYDWKKFRTQKNPSRAKLLETCISNVS